MTDREKVIKAVEEAFDLVHSDFIGTDDFNEKEWEQNKADALALLMLKEQEPIEPVDDGHGSLICGNQGFGCGCVGRYDITTKVVEKYCNFCPECGREVKWG